MMHKKPYQQSIVQIFDKDNDVIGTGVIIAKKYILTCGHVICDALSIKHEDIKATIDKKITIGLHNSNKKSKQQAKTLHAILNEDSNKNTYNDIALLLLDEEVNIPNYPLIEARKSSLDVKIFGFDEYHGRWVNAKYIGNNFLALGQINPELNNIMDYGFSGAPVWDEENNGIIGIIVAKKKWIQDEKELIKEAYLITESYMIPSSTILEIDEFKKYLGSYIRPRNPYKGLNSFGEKDSQFYFGRNDEVSKVMSKLSLNSKYRFFSIIGISGVGKSSFLNAGLIPILKNNFEYTVISLRPSSNPFEEMASKLIGHLEEDKTQHAKKTRKMQEDFSTTENISGIRDQLKVISKEVSPIIIIIDQFEELFTNSSKKVQSLFLMQLLEIINDKDLPVQIVISIRVDFLEKLLNYPEYINILNDDIKHFIGNLENEKLKDIILKPAHIQNVRFEDGVIERILNDIENVKGKLPLLEFALTKLWENQEYGVITNKALDELGGVVASLGKYAEDVFNEFETEEEKESVRRVMLQLIHPGAGAEDTRQIATFDNFIDEDRKTITKLATKRLIVTGSGENKSEQQVEIIHEALIAQWSTLKIWIEEGREFRLWQNKLRLTIADWEKDKIYDESYLLRGRQLEEAEEKLKLFPKELEPDKDFIKKSIEARDIQLELENLEVEKKIKRNRHIKIGVTTFVIALSATTVYSFYQKNIADNRLATIEKQRDQVIWTYWTAFLDVDRQDSVINNPNVLNSVLNMLDYSSDNKAKAIEILMREGINKIPREKPFLSKNSIDFVVFISQLQIGNIAFFNENIDELSTNFIWLWNDEQIELFSNFLTKIINKETPYIINIEKVDIEKYKYLLSLMNFIVQPTEDNLDKVTSFEYFFMEEDSEKEILKGGLEAILDYERYIVSNHFHFKRTKLTTVESKEISEYVSEKVKSTKYPDEIKTIILNIYKEAKNAYFDAEKSKLSKLEVEKIVKLYLNRVQNIAEILSLHSQKHPKLYSDKQKKNISNMNYHGIYHIKPDTISKKEYPDLNKTLPNLYRQKYFKFKKSHDIMNTQKELESILQLEQDNPWALARLSELFFEKNEKNIELFSKDKEFLKEWKKTISLVLNNQNLDSTIEGLKNKEKRSLSDMYQHYANFYRNKGNYNGAILNTNLGLKYILDDNQKSDRYGNLSWWYLFVKEYQQAIDSAKKAFKYDKNQIWVQGNLAHAYLLNNQKEKAIAIYKKYKGYKIHSSTKLWENATREDFKIFKEANITSPYFDEVERLLFSSSKN